MYALTKALTAVGTSSVALGVKYSHRSMPFTESLRAQGAAVCAYITLSCMWQLTESAESVGAAVVSIFSVAVSVGAAGAVPSVPFLLPHAVIMATAASAVAMSALIVCGYLLVSWCGACGHTYSPKSVRRMSPLRSSVSWKASAALIDCGSWPRGARRR